MTKLLKIIVAKLASFLNNEHYSFILEMLGICEKFDPPALSIENEYLALKALCSKENDALDPIRTSEYTPLIQVSDERRVSIIMGLENLVKANLKNPDAVSAASAKRVKALLDSHPDIYRKSYNVKTGAIADIVYELKKDLMEDIARLGATNWVSALDDENNNFISLTEKRFAEESSQTRENMLTVRAEADAAYNALIARLGALMVVDETPERYTPLATELNQCIKYYNGRVKQRATTNKKRRQDIGTAAISTIGEQVYTGAQIIPAVKVVYTNAKMGEAVQLEEGRDYTVSCTNNIQPGTATMTIKGKGTYTGKLLTTFNVKAN